MTIVLAILYSDSPPCALLVRYGVEWFYFYVPLHGTSFNPSPRLSRMSLWTTIQMVITLTSNVDQCFTQLFDRLCKRLCKQLVLMVTSLGEPQP